MNSGFIDILFKIGLKYDFGNLRPYLKIITSFLRYYLTLFGKRHNEKREVIFIAGLPKSGTTWLENLLCFQGRYKSIMLPMVTIWEQFQGRSDNYIPKTDFIEKLPSRGKWLIKLHCHNSNDLNEILSKHKIIPIVIHRELDKVFESHYHYALNTKFHPDYKSLNNLKMKQGFEYLYNKYEKDYEQWIISWQKSNKAVIITYSELLDDTFNTLKKTVNSIGLNLTQEEIIKTIENNTIEKMKKRSVHKKFFRGSDIK